MVPSLTRTGLHKGGTPPLGYRPDGRTLAIVDERADLIWQIYARYLVVGNVRNLTEAFEIERLHAPLRQRLSGAAFGGDATG